MSQAAFSARVDLPQTTISSIERGAGQQTIVNLLKIAEACGLSLNWLFYGIGPVQLRETYRPTIEEGPTRLVALTGKVEAPGLNDLLKDAQLTAQVKLSLDEAAALVEAAEALPDFVRLNYKKLDWVALLRSYREGRLKVLTEFLGGGPQKQIRGE